MKSFPFFSFPFLSNPLFTRMMNIFENTNITEDADDNKKVSLTTSVDGVTFTTVIGVDGDVLFKANVSVTNRDDKNSIVNILLSKAEDVLVNCSPSVRVELTIYDKTYEFSGVCENENNVAFVTTNDEGVTGYMYHLTTDDNYIKEWFFTDDLYVAFGKKRENEPCCDCPCYGFNDCEVVDESPITTEQPNDPVDETHVYTDEEIDRYANFMCNVVCGDCVRDTCVGCEVVGEYDNDAREGRTCDDCDGCGVICPMSETISNDEITIPNTLEDCDFANFIKNKHRHVVDYNKMMTNLRNVLVNNDYDIEDNYVVVLMEDVIKESDFLKDKEIVDIVLNKEKNRLESFLVQATNKFGFKSFKYEEDTVFGHIDLKFELPE